MQTEIAELRQDIQELMQALNLQPNPFELFDQRLARIETVLLRIEQQKTDPPQTDNYIGVDEAAAFVRLKKSTIYKLVSTRKIPFKKTSKILLFLPSELRTWINSSRKASK